MTLPAHLRDTLIAQHAPESHLARMTALCALAADDPACRAVALVGSYAKGSGDRISDLDLVAFTTAGHCQHFSDAAHRFLASPQLLDVLEGTHKSAGAFRKYVYLDFSSCELHAFDLPATFKLRRPFLPVWDPHGVLAQQVVDGAPVRHEDFVAYEYGDAGLIWELVDCIKWLKRGRAELARHHLRKIVARLDAPPTTG
jgi:hypothetical protein